jgi:hypothetical protein
MDPNNTFDSVSRSSLAPPCDNDLLLEETWELAPTSERYSTAWQGLDENSEIFFAHLD